ncbi:hypothetical protein L6V77_09140 [Myxococcota bacterium]|jgi:hypothetical protein|nr:hypothetical protein [Myxococcota bacterium]
MVRSSAVPAPLGWFFAVFVALFATGCRDSPAEVVQRASEAAASRDVVAVRDLFSVQSQRRFVRRWEQQQRTEDEGWQDLVSKLAFDGRALEVKDETIAGDFARVEALAGAEKRDYYLHKEDGRWRLEPGAGARFRKAHAKLNPKAAADEAADDESEDDDAASDSKPAKKKKPKSD